MRQFVLRRPSPALVVAFVALLVALGGTSYAAFTLPKNSVGSKQLKKNAVTTSKIKNGAVIASKINPNGLTVPNATHASSADSATNASHASSAENASNADSLGGVAAAQYDRPGALLQSGDTEHGVFAGGGGPNAFINIQIQFDPLLAANLDTAHTIRVTGSSATHCPGTGQADPGYLCWYEKQSSNVAFSNFGDPVRATEGANAEGMNVFYATTGNSAYVYGEWAFTAP
jgi:hypothetical protein